MPTPHDIDTRHASLHFLLLRCASLGSVLPVQPDGPKIRRQREEHGYGLRRFAEAAQIDHSYLSRIERGQRSPQPEVMARIATTLGVSISDLKRSETEPNDGGDEHLLARPDHHEGTRGHPPQDP
ncbi:helix-turn-helix transcriptional regulator [Streptomyces sp. NPDC051577]|uniref:helix-turn-helix domain-containing protein n=1 Tax=Streptomyces sp. NPDC051577 TaxID=3155166 RepID=UPI00341C21BE